MKINKMLLIGACLVFAFATGCSKVEEAAEKTRKKSNEAFDKIVIDPQRKAEEAKDKMNKALDDMQKSIDRATGDAKDNLEEATK